MSKFWIFVAGLLVLPVALFLTGSSGGGEISFTDLETECRHDRPSSDVQLSSEGSLSFSGNFPVDDSDADLDYSYRRSGDRIRLEVSSTRTSEEIEYVDDCLASAVYQASTPPLSDGTYLVSVSHDGEEAYRSVIKVS